MNDIDIEWKDVAAKLEETEFKDEKQKQLAAQQAAQQQEAAKTETEQQNNTDAPDEYEAIGLASLISGVWNEVAVDKGYEPVTEKQDAFLQRHTARLEEKWLKDKTDMLPEIDAALSHAVVYLPKWLHHRKEMNNAKASK